MARASPRARRRDVRRGRARVRGVARRGEILDTVFWVFGKGLVATALAVAGLVARAILGEDARGATGARRDRCVSRVSQTS